MSATSSLIKDQTADIPVFLRKTYSMVDTADPDICTWSEDGETFIIKDPKIFEKKVIPQFFKHNKFSSFVRQLNFYSFRKLRYNDDVRIDPEMEALTANYWRFYHPKFQKGHPEWLMDIKRTISQPKPGTTTSPSSAKPTTVKSNNGATPDAENLKLKTEVTDLKERIEAMTRNIDQLTSMVKQVTLNQKDEEKKDETILFHKRAKVGEDESDDVFPDVALSIPPSSAYNETSMDVADGKPEEPLPVMDGSMQPAMPSPVLISTLPPLRETSGNSLFSDGFVEELFTTFKEGDSELGDNDEEISSWNVAISPETTTLSNPSNRPSAELMNRLSDALSMLPRDIQEMIVDRLIEAITAPKEVQESIQVAHALEEAMGGRPMSVPQSPKHESASSASDAMDEDDDSHAVQGTDASPALPLAAATLAALLQRYGKSHHDDDHDDHQVAEAAAAMKKSKDDAQKSLLIPVHA